MAPRTTIAFVPTMAITAQHFQLHGKGRGGVFPCVPLWLGAWYSWHSSWSLRDSISHRTPSRPTVLQLETGSRRHQLQPRVLASLSSQGIFASSLVASLQRCPRWFSSPDDTRQQQWPVSASHHSHTGDITPGPSSSVTLEQQPPAGLEDSRLPHSQRGPRDTLIPSPSCHKC